MPKTRHHTKTFRIFVSSTFSDFKTERDELQSDVFQGLRNHCESRGYKFQVVDLRWGVTDEAGLDQQTMKICLDEIRRCQEISPRPNFIILLGDRYGWRPLPYEIRRDEFEKFIFFIKSEFGEQLLRENEIVSETAQKLLNKWYILDENALPECYLLKPRETGITDLMPLEMQKKLIKEENECWGKVENSIRAIFRVLLEHIPDLSDEERFKYMLSATEQEIVAGALNDPRAAAHVFCFSRHIAGIPKDNSSRGYIDPDDSGDPDGMLEALRVKLQKALPKENIFKYEAEWKDGKVTTGHIKKLCEDVEDSLKRVINDRIESDNKNKSKFQEISAHEYLKKSLSDVFIGREDVLKDILEYAGNDSSPNQPFMVQGVSGTGKTALMAKAIDETGMRFSDIRIIFRFIGATAQSSDIRYLLSGICDEICTIFGFDIESDSEQPRFQNNYEKAAEIKNEFETTKDMRYLPGIFAALINKIPREEKVIIFIDALDQLQNIENALRMEWMPKTLPVNVKVILSTLAHFEETRYECYDELKTALAPGNMIELKTMGIEDGQTILKAWLLNANRNLTAEQMKLVLGSFERNPYPLYLKLCFEEACQWKSGTQACELGSNEMEMIGIIFRRLSRKHGVMLVDRCLGYLAASKSGLSEDELIDILSFDAEFFVNFKKNAYWKDLPKIEIVEDGKKIIKEKVPVVLWSRLYFDLAPFLCERSFRGMTLLNFYHRHILEAARKKYLCSDEKIKKHKILAEYFLRRPNLIESPDCYFLNYRRNDELPYHLLSCEWYSKLFELLSDLDFFAVSWTINNFDFYRYWSLLEKNSGYRILNAYKNVIENPEKNYICFGELSHLLSNFGHLDMASELLKCLIEKFRNSGEKKHLSSCLGRHATILMNSGKMNEAIDLLTEQERICKELKDFAGLASAFNNQAIILKKMGILDVALRLHKDAEYLYKLIGDWQGVSNSLGNQALILNTTGNTEQAMTFLKEEERICKQSGDKIRLASCYGSQANILLKMEKSNEAMTMFKEQENICREFGILSELQISLGNQAVVFIKSGNYGKAMELLKEKERICRKTENKSGLSISLGNQAVILKNMHLLDEAMSLFKEQENISVELKDRAGLSASYGNQALLLMEQGRAEDAIVLFKEEENICREIDIKDDLWKCLYNQALCLQDGLNDPAGARLKLEDALEILNQYFPNSSALKAADNLMKRILENIVKDEHANAPQNVSSNGSKSPAARALIFFRMGKLKEAMELFQKQEKISRGAGEKSLLSVSLGFQALILINFGQLDKAMELLKEQELICRESKDMQGLSQNCGNQALILIKREELDEAMKYLKEQEKICVEAGIKSVLQICLGNQATVFIEWNKLDKAMNSLKEQERICRELNIRDHLGLSLYNQARLYFIEMNDPAGANSKLTEAIELLKQYDPSSQYLPDARKMLYEINREPDVENEDCTDFEDDSEELKRLADTLGEEALELKNSGNHEVALDLFARQEKVLRKIRDFSGLASCLNNQATILADLENFDKALIIHKEQEQICLDISDEAGLATCYGNKGLILYQQGRFDEAMELMEIQEKISRNLNNNNILWNCLYNQAHCLFYKLNHLEKAYKKIKESIEIMEKNFPYSLNIATARKLMKKINEKLK